MFSTLLLQDDHHIGFKRVGMKQARSRSVYPESERSGMSRPGITGSNATEDRPAGNRTAGCGLMTTGMLRADGRIRFVERSGREERSRSVFTGDA
jgi:hypothetical protein